MATLPFRPPLGLALTFAQLIEQREGATTTAQRFDATGNDYAAQDADEYARAISTELRDRLQSFVGNEPLDAVLGAL